MVEINVDLVEHHFPIAQLSSSDSEVDEEALVISEEPPPMWSSMSNVLYSTGKKRLLSKQLSMRETSREAKWEKRRQQILLERQRMLMIDGDEHAEDHEVEYEDRRSCSTEVGTGMKRSLTDADLDELRGSIELGFGFNEEEGGLNLCNTLPALDLYFAVNRQFSDLKIISPSTTSSSSTQFGSPSPRSPNAQQSGNSEPWKICSPGDKPQHVKVRLRHWAQVVACSVRQSC